MDAALAIWSSFLASLAAPKTAMSVLELDGYLTGIAVTPQTPPILPSAWIARVWGDDESIFYDDARIKVVLGTVIRYHNALIAKIDRSLNRLEADGIADYRPLFLSGDHKPTHDTGRRFAAVQQDACN